MRAGAVQSFLFTTYCSSPDCVRNRSHGCCRSRHSPPARFYFAAFLDSLVSLSVTYWTLEFPGDVAQLVRAPDCRSGGCGFEPRRPRFISLIQFLGLLACSMQFCDQTHGWILSRQFRCHSGGLRDLNSDFYRYVFGISIKYCEPMPCLAE